MTGLAVAGEQGVIQRFEMQVSKGHGRIVPFGSIQRVMRESIEAAAQYVLTHAKDLGIPADWRENFDVAVLATQMGIPKEGPSAGVTIVTGIVSALKDLPVRHDIAMTGEITIMGKVLAVGGIQAKLLAAIEAGVKTVILPAENEQDVRFLPDYMRDKAKLVYVRDIQEALEVAFAVRLAVIAHLRHAETNYDQLLSRGYERRDARAEVEGQVARVLAQWSRNTWSGA